MCALTHGGTNLMAISALKEIRLKDLLFSNFVEFTLFMFPSLENSHFCGHTFGKVLLLTWQLFCLAGNRILQRL